MRNDVTVPPDDAPARGSPLVVDPIKKSISLTPIAPPGKLVADVGLHDRPDMLPGGAGNFWLLGFIGLLVAGIAVTLLFVFFRHRIF